MNEFDKFYTKHMCLSSSALNKYKNGLGYYNSGNIISPDGNIIDIFSKLLSERTIFIGSELSSPITNIIKAQLLYLEYDDPTADVKIYIDSPGGQIYTSLGIIDTMDIISCDVETVNVGLAASMGAVLLACGTEGKRKSLKRSRTMIHQPLGYSGFAQASDLEIDAKQIGSLKRELYEILSERTGKSYEKIVEDGDRDYWMNAKEAKDYGIIDEIVSKR